MEAGPGTSNGEEEKTTNKEVVLEYYIINDDEFERTVLAGEISYDAICRICGKTVKDQWKGDKQQNKKWRNTTSLQRHLRSHKEEWESEIAPRMSAGKIPRRSAAPSNSTHTGEHDKYEFYARVGSCFRCGIAVTFNNLNGHRRRNGYGSYMGCPFFGSFYKNNVAPELQQMLVARKWNSLGVEHLLKMRADRIGQFVRYCATDPTTVPLRREQMENGDRSHGVYLHIPSSCESSNVSPSLVSNWIYFGRSKVSENRERQHNSGVSRYIAQGFAVPGHTALHIAHDLTIHQSRCLEYLSIQLRDIDNKYPKCPSNIQLPMPYIHHSRSLDGVQHATENKEIHAKGRRIASELALIAHFLFVRGHRAHVIAMEAGESDDPDEQLHPATKTKKKQAFPDFAL